MHSTAKRSARVAGTKRQASEGGNADGQAAKRCVASQSYCMFTIIDLHCSIREVDNPEENTTEDTELPTESDVLVRPEHLT